MNPRTLIALLAAYSTISLTAQIGIGTSNPSANAALDITSSNKGLLLPRLSTNDQNAMQTPSEGLVVYNTSTKKVQVYTGNEAMWVTSGLGGTYNASATLMSGLSVYQVFTATNTQPIQKFQFEFISSSSGTVNLSVYDGSGTGGSVLATASQSVSVSSPATNATVTFTLSSPISLTSGGTYTVQLSTTGTSYVGANTNDPYNGGDSHLGGGIDLLFGILSTGSWSNLN